MLVAGIALLAIGAALVFVFRSQQRKLADILGTETSSVAGLHELRKEFQERGGGPFIQQVELSGVIECDSPLVSELAGQKCVYYRMRVEREWEEDYWETDTRTGRRERRTRRGSETMASNERSAPFRLRDETGAIGVDPQGADIETNQVVDRFEPGETQSATLSFGSFVLSLSGGTAGNRRTLGYRFQEWITPLGQKAYLLGTVREKDGDLQVCRSPDGKSRFLVSLRSEEDLVRSLRSTLTALQVGIGICFLGGVALIIAHFLST